MLKYEKARKLKEYIQEARLDYSQKIKSKVKEDKQLGSALYLIDKLALRVGNEKSNDEADTVGCCSLRVEHIKFEENNTITLDFIGKDFIRYNNTIEIDPEVYTNLISFTQNKEIDDELFDLIRSNDLNEYLKNLMDGLSAKVFRTFNASVGLQENLEDVKNGSVDEKIQFFYRANKKVALLCNHQKTAPKNFELQMKNLQDRLNEKKVKLEKLKSQLKLLKKTKMKTDDTKRKIKNLKEISEKLLSKIELKNDTKNIALETSKINYIDPRITIAWCKRNKVPVDKVYSKSLREKFKWAMNTEPDWKF